MGKSCGETENGYGWRNLSGFALELKSNGGKKGLPHEHDFFLAFKQVRRRNNLEI